MKTTFTGLLAAAALALGVTSVSAQTIVVGGKNFTEQQIMTEMTAQLLRANGFTADKRAGMGSSVVRQAQENGQVHVYWEYTGTSLITYNKITDRLSMEDTYKKVKDIDGAKGLVWLNPSKANNTYALAVRGKDEKTDSLKTLSDLAKVAGKLKLGAGPEFGDRRDGLKGLKEVYGIEFGEFRQFAALRLRYEALAQKQIDVANGFATDWQIAAAKFAALDDDKSLFPPYYLAPVVRMDTVANHPKVVETLERVGALLDNTTMQELNRQVEVDKKEPRQVAAQFLKAKGVIH
jgi:osmoprotectant transport system substrate-binding protein